MAGTFTHWMIVEESMDRFNRLPSKHHYFQTILGNDNFVLLGAVGPDYPYLSELEKNILKLHSWADRMHYENTGEFVKFRITNLQRFENNDFDVCLSWLCGYVTHLLTDSIIHPVVNATVGPYVFNSGEHRHCEMIQDSFIFKQIKGVELNYAGYTNLIKMCSATDNKNHLNQAVSSFWTKTLEMSHPGGRDKFKTINPDDWHQDFLSKINMAANPLPIFRHIGEETNLAYKKTDAITDDENRKFIAEIKLPGETTGNFQKDAFNNAVDKVLEVWQTLFTDIENNKPGNTAAYIKNWNLDTGVDDDKPYFW